MKRCFLTCVFALGLATLLALQPQPATAADYEWRLSVGYPRGVALADLYPPFAEKIEELSGGRIEVSIMYDGEGVDQEGIWSAVQTGLVEMGLPYMALFAGDFPAGMVQIGLPGGPDSYLELRALYRTTEWADVLREGYSEHGVHLLGEEYQLPTYLLTIEPIESLDDLQGMRIRAPGAYGRLFRNLGATPVAMAYGEVYTGLATGVIEGVDAMNIVDFLGGNFHEIAGYLYPLPVTGSQAFPILVNQRAWDDLPEDLRAVLEAAATWHAENMAVRLLEMEREALNQMREEGLEMGPDPSSEDVKRWREAGQQVWDEYAEDEYSQRAIEVQRTFLETLGR